MNERALHKSAVLYLAAALPAQAWFCHIPNGERRDAKTGALLKAMGVKAGVPDLLILWQGLPHWIELKADKGRLSQNQQLTIAAIERAGCPVALCRSLEEIEAALLGFGIVPRATVGKRAA